jgi:L,D-transpeptidase ErfK/SrfK
MKPFGTMSGYSRRFSETASLWLMVWLALLLPAPAHADAPAEIIGSRFVYTAGAGDTLARVGARHGLEPAVLAADNGLRADSRLKAGQQLVIDNRHIVPERMIEGIVINLPQRMLFLFKGGVLVHSYPVAVGRHTWPTPTGTFEVITLVRHKTWIVPRSIQNEMRREGKPVRESVPPGPDNPLGDYWIGLSLPGYGIHATNAPASIYGFRTHGCIRLHPDDAANLFALVRRGFPVRIVYRRILLTDAGTAGVFLEIHRDIYRKGGEAFKMVQQLAADEGLSGRVDWREAERMARREEGIARAVGR